MERERGDICKMGKEKSLMLILKEEEPVFFRHVYATRTLFLIKKCRTSCILRQPYVVLWHTCVLCVTCSLYSPASYLFSPSNVSTAT